jgi:mono/diheme cytochrome c family protein
MSRFPARSAWRRKHHGESRIEIFQSVASGSAGSTATPANGTGAQRPPGVAWSATDLRSHQPLLIGLVLATCLLASATGMQAAEPVTQTPATLPPLAEARTVGRQKSLYLQQPTTKSTPATGPATANLADFTSQIRPTLTSSCTPCHGPDKQKGQFRVDTLNPDLVKGGDVSKWLKVLDAVNHGEMPPENDKDIHLDDQPRRSLTAWLEAELEKASRVQSELGGSSFRRMTRYEYNYALQDLTGLPYDFAAALPPETASKDGFLNSAPLLQMSGMQFERYRELGLAAMQKATVTGARPPLVAYSITLNNLIEKAKDQAKDKDGEKKPVNEGRVHLKNVATGALFAIDDDYKPKSTTVPDVASIPKPGNTETVVVLAPHQQWKLNLGEALPDAGIMRVRLRAGRTTMEANEYIAVRLIFSAHTSNNAHFSEVISRRDVPVTAPADQPEFIQFDIPLSEITRNPFRKMSTTIGRPDEFLTFQIVANSNGKKGAAPLKIHADYLEIIAPYHEQWPPPSHTGIFIESKNQGNEKAYASDVLVQFMSRAWRRPVTAAEAAPFVSLFTRHRAAFPSFEAAMLEVCATILAAPEFLYLTETQTSKPTKGRQTISDMELASRLSFFLWCSLPDEELRTVAAQGKLSDPKTMAMQTKRMLADERAQRFATNFVAQWLGLAALDHVAFDDALFKGTNDAALREAMREEPVAFFNEVLRQNKSVMDFIHADYVVVNERLARHYQIPDVYGPHFRPVPIDAARNRGGLLTTAGTLAMNSNGKDSHPVKRGVWILERLLHDPPPPPPPNVPEVDLTNPEILKMSLKERIEDHRKKPACFSCHAKIDPWGIALENYDAIGAYRTQVNKKPVDANATLFNQQPLAGMDGLKRYLLTERQDQFAHAMVHKLLSFALGRPLSFGDRGEVERLTRQFRKQDDRLGDLISLITTSDLFRAK